jgi:hypothetical protein
MIGALLAATVFIPVGWSLLRDERQRTVEARAAAEENAALAQKYKAQIDQTNAGLLAQADKTMKDAERYMKEVADKPWMSGESRKAILDMLESLRKAHDDLREK